MEIKREKGKFIINGQEVSKESKPLLVGLLNIARHSEWDGSDFSDDATTIATTAVSEFISGLLGHELKMTKYQVYEMEEVLLRGKDQEPLKLNEQIRVFEKGGEYVSAVFVSKWGNKVFYRTFNKNMALQPEKKTTFFAYVVRGW